MEHGNISLLKHLGRWESDKSLEHYLQEAVSFLVEQQVRQGSEAMVEWLLTLEEAFDAPPTRHWSRFFDRIRQVAGQINIVKRALRSKGVLV